jgi:hypothetical protein
MLNGTVKPYLYDPLAQQNRPGKLGEGNFIFLKPVEPPLLIFKYNQIITNLRPPI